MAFSKTPTQDTYDTKRFPLVGMPQQRDGITPGKDQRFLNCFVEQIKAQVTEAKKYYLKKRSGLLRKAVPNAGAARGMIYEDTTKKLFFVVGTSVYAYDGTTLSLISTLIAGTNPVGFTIHLTTTISVILVTGEFGYVINPVTNGITQITDVDFPNPHLPFPVSMDGYLFLAKANTADIYNSDLDDPFGWDPSQFITAEMYPDNIVALTKNNNYVIAVGSGSTEYFYDAGTATGSPLARNDSAVSQTGTVAPYTVVQTEKEICYIGSTGNGGRTVWIIDGFKPEEAATEAVRLSLNEEGTAIATANAYCIRVDGHKFYVIRLTQSSRTWVYDFDSKLWHEWSSASGIFLGKYASDSQYGVPYMLGAQSQAVVYLMDDGTYQDDGAPITTQATTLKLDFDNMNRKDMYRASIFGDWPGSGSATMTLEWSDDDYRTWSNPRTINITSNYPWTRRLGKFRRRAFRITHLENTPLRLEGMEVDINNGTS